MVDTALKNCNTKTALEDGSTSPSSENSKQIGTNGGIQDVAQQSNLLAPGQGHIAQHSASPAFDESSMIDKFSPNGSFVNMHDGLPLPGKTSDEIHVPFNSTLHTFPMDMPMPIHAVVHSTEPPCDCCKQLLYMNDMLGRFALTCTRNMADQRIRDADIPIRAVVHGWDAVTHLHPLDPIWTMLRTADESVWRTCGAVERVGILRVVSLMLRVCSIFVFPRRWLTLIVPVRSVRTQPEPAAKIHAAAAVTTPDHTQASHRLRGLVSFPPSIYTFLN